MLSSSNMHSTQPSHGKPERLKECQANEKVPRTTSSEDKVGASLLTINSLYAEAHTVVDPNDDAKLSTVRS